MGMTIEEYESSDLMAENEFLRKQLAEALKHRRMFEADYENRLKADLKAILVELQLEIEELDSRAGYDGNGMPTFSTDYIRKKKVNELIRRKINELGGKSEG